VLKEIQETLCLLQTRLKRVWTSDRKKLESIIWLEEKISWHVSVTALARKHLPVVESTEERVVVTGKKEDMRELVLTYQCYCGSESMYLLHERTQKQTEIRSKEVMFAARHQIKFRNALRKLFLIIL
jgi:hypothetical protein